MKILTVENIFFSLFRIWFIVDEVGYRQHNSQSVSYSGCFTKQLLTNKKEIPLLC